MVPGQTGRELGIGDRESLDTHILVCSRQASMLRTRPARGADPVWTAFGLVAASFPEHVPQSHSAHLDW